METGSSTTASATILISQLDGGLGEQTAHVLQCVCSFVRFELRHRDLGKRHVAAEISISSPPRYCGQAGSDCG